MRGSGRSNHKIIKKLRGGTLKGWWGKATLPQNEPANYETVDEFTNIIKLMAQSTSDFESVLGSSKKERIITIRISKKS